MLSASAAHAQVFSPAPPDVWPQAVGAPVTGSQIWQLFRDLNFSALWRIAKDEGIKAGMNEVTNYVRSPVKMKKLAAQLNAIIDDPAKSPTQKADELIQLTDNSFAASSSAPAGELNVTMKHSVELGVTRLEWDDRVRDGTQDAYRVTGSCSGTTTGMGCNWGGSYSRCYYRSQPDYYIYRIVNGQQTLITILKGSMYSSSSSSFQINDKLWKSAWNAAKYYYTNIYNGNYPDVVPGRAFFYDFQSDMRPPGSTLSYKVITFDDWLFPVVNNSVACGAATGSYHETTVTADGNADGRPDFLVAADYSRYFGKYMGWMPGVIGSLLKPAEE
jgi:hypothetical protein